MKVPAQWVGGPRDGKVEMIDDFLRHVIVASFPPVAAIHYGEDGSKSIVSDKTACPVTSYAHGAVTARYIIHPDAADLAPRFATQRVLLDRVGGEGDALVQYTEEAVVRAAHKDAGLPRACTHNVTVAYEDDKWQGRVAVVTAECWPVSMVSSAARLQQARAAGHKAGWAAALDALRKYADRLADGDGVEDTVVEFGVRQALHHLKKDAA